MRRTILIVPGMLSLPEGDSFLRPSPPTLSTLAERSVLSKVAEVPPSETPEAMLLGLGPSEVRLAQGPLTVSSLGFDPPERSTHFHLSLATLSEGMVAPQTVLPNPAEVDVLLAAAKRLDTKLLTVLKGEEFDHALVWESMGDMGTTPISRAHGNLMSDVLPEGDGESTLRRFIDDSVNLLSDLELNERRVDEGLPPFNLLWPWGQGVRTKVPNLALRRGEPAFVESASMRLAGLVRLAGYRHGDRHQFGRGLATKLRAIARRALERDLTIVLIDALDLFRRDNKPEELDWFIREMDRELFEPLLDDQLKNPSRLTLIAPGPLSSATYAESLTPSKVGSALVCDSDRPGSNSYPFDERSLDERSIPTRDLWALVLEGI